MYEWLASWLAVKQQSSACTTVPPRLQSSRVVVANATTAERLARAKGYPYPRPATSFIFCNGAAYTFDDSAWVTPSQWHGSLEHLLQLQVTAPDGTRGSFGAVLAQQGVKQSVLTAETPLTPILAIGSNAGPEQLARKFPLDMFPDGVVVPVIQCVLQDFDVVFAPLISSYGAATATLEHSPGTAVSVFMTYLTPPLQQRMHETEGAYNLCRMEGVQLREGLALPAHLEAAQPVAVHATAYNYNHQSGTLHLPFDNPGSSPVALTEIAAAGRTYPALTQVQMQAALRAALTGVTAEQLPGTSGSSSQPLHKLNTLPSIQQEPPGGAEEPLSAEGLDDWILSNLDQPTLRRARVSALVRAAQPFQYRESEVLMVIGTALSTSVK
ncbi:hypothetical protein COO60DRAFT_1623787 [Scenedesmus sp. NREL 46B-D3]|nr:hypothetical protein COO60DRAFT_1623787 [Scenedesmus sp. NREL 46B-D3]